MYRNPIGWRWLVLASVCWVHSTAKAVPLPINNPSFEDPAVPEFPLTPIVNPTGWTGGFVANPLSTDFVGEAPDGLNVGVALDAGFGSPFPLRQTLSSVLTNNTQYTLEVLVGQTVADGSQYLVQLLAGSTVLAQDLNTVPLTPGVFSLVQLPFTSGASEPLAGQNLRLALWAAPPLFSLAPAIMYYDSVALDARPIPEPSTGVLAVAGAALVALWRRRSKHRFSK